MDEIKKIITVDTSQAVKALDDVKKATDNSNQSFSSMREYKEYVDKMRAALADLDTTTEEYTKAANDVAKAQDKYNQILSETKTTTSAAEGSYNALAKQMAELRKAWKSTTDEVEREAIGKQINEINDQLKTLDASIGNYQRNVGNYASGFTAGMKDMLDGLDNLAPGAKKAGKAFEDLNKAGKAFIANPIGAIIAGIVAAFMLLKNAISDNERATESIKKAMASFEPILNMVSNAVAWLADKIAIAVDWLGTKLTGALEFVVNKGLNNFVNGVIKGINLLTTPIKTFISWVVGAIEGIVSAANKLGQITGLFDISGAVDALDRARNSVKEFEIGTVNLGLSFEKMSAKAESAAASTDKMTKATKEAKEEAEKLVDALGHEINTLKERLKITEENSKEYFDLLREIENKEWEQQEQRLKDEQYTDDQIEIYRKSHLKRLADIDTQETKASEPTKADSVDWKKLYDTKKKEIDEEAALDAYIESKKPTNTFKEEYDQQIALLDIERTRLEGRKALIEEMLADDQLEVEAKEQLKDELARINADIQDNDDQRTSAAIANVQKQVNTYSQMASSISSIMSTIGSIMEDDIKRKVESGEMSEQEAEKEFERVKALQYATTWINTLAGVATAIAGAMSLGPIAGPIVGAVNSAAVLASGIAQTVKIKQTKFDGKGAGQGGQPTGGAAPSVPAVSYTPEYTANLTGASQVEELQNAVSQGTTQGQQNIKVYVTESDIREAGNRVEVRDSEATF